MLDALTEHWDGSRATRDRLHMERFQPIIGGEDAEHGEGGTIRFCDERRRGRAATARQPILVAGEEAGATLPVRLPDGHLPHLRRALLLGPGPRPAHRRGLTAQDGEMVRTCVNAPEGPVEIEL